MKTDASAADPGEPPSAFCPHCKRRSDPAAIGGMVGLCYCSSCTAYACRWCWAEAAGACPVCGFSYLAAAAPPMTLRRGTAMILRRLDLRRSIAAGALFVVAIVLAVTLGGGFRPAGGVEGDVNVPTATPTDGAASTPQESPSSGATAPGVTADPTSAPTATGSTSEPRVTTPPGGTTPPARTPTSTPTRPTSTPTRGPTPIPTPTSTVAPTPTPTPTPIPSPTPTPTPTPSPTPPPTPTPVPTPTPACMTVPTLTGLTVAAARTAWTGAGFTGSFSPAHGNDTKTVVTQSQTPGACLAADTKITVTFK